MIFCDSFSLKLVRGLLLTLFATCPIANAVVIRDDVEDDKYRVPASAFPALADFPGEGHGILIAPLWVITVAHVVSSQEIAEISVNGLMRKVRRTVVHPGYKALPDALAKEALATGDASKILAFLASSDDLALVELKAPVTDVEPIKLFRGKNEVGKSVQIVGKGATAKGDAGESPDSPHRTSLRRAFNVITSVDDRWISYTFDSPESAAPLEGMMGSGDSGGPVLVENKGQWQLAGLTSWKSVKGDLRTYRPGRYGDGGNNVRISHYVDWIESVISPERRESRDSIAETEE